MSTLIDIYVNCFVFYFLFLVVLRKSFLYGSMGNRNNMIQVRQIKPDNSWLWAIYVTLTYLLTYLAVEVIISVVIMWFYRAI